MQSVQILILPSYQVDDGHFGACLRTDSSRSRAASLSGPPGSGPMAGRPPAGPERHFDSDHPDAKPGEGTLLLLEDDLTREPISGGVRPVIVTSHHAAATISWLRIAFVPVLKYHTVIAATAD